MKCRTIPREYEYRIYNPKNIFGLYNFIPYEIIKNNKMKCKLKESLLEFRIFMPDNIFELCDFVDFCKIKIHFNQLMVPTKDGMCNIYKYNYIVKSGDFFEVYTKEEFDKKYDVCR